MRSFLLAATSLLAACAAGAPPANDSIPIHGVTPGHKCDTAGTDQFIGRPGNSETGAAIMRASKAAVLRWAPPGYMLTMDFREDRVTVHLGADYRVTAIKCG